MKLRANWSKDPIFSLPIDVYYQCWQAPRDGFGNKGVQFTVCCLFCETVEVFWHVFASETLISCPKLIWYVKRSGLVRGSYGLENNISKNATVRPTRGMGERTVYWLCLKAQAAAGIDIPVADRVGLVSADLRMAISRNSGLALSTRQRPSHI
jgi:hypothetical protein